MSSESPLEATELEMAARDALQIIGGMPAGRTVWNQDEQVGYFVGHVWSRLQAELDRLKDERDEINDHRGVPNDTPF